MCQQIFGRKYSAERHNRLKHHGEGRVMPYRMYGPDPASEPAPSWGNGLNRRRRGESMKSSSYSERFIYDVFQEDYRRSVQRAADNLDPAKNQEYMKNLLNLFREYQNAPVIEVAGYIASICKDCLEPSVQTTYYCRDPATGEHFGNLPAHRCSEENLNRAKHVDRTKETEIAWKRAEEGLIAAVSRWGKKEKLLLSYPCNAREDGFVDLGKDEEGSWAWRVFKGTAILNGF